MPLVFDLAWLLLVLVLILAGIAGIGILSARKQLHETFQTDEGKNNDNHDD